MRYKPEKLVENFLSARSSHGNNSLSAVPSYLGHSAGFPQPTDSWPLPLLTAILVERNRQVFFCPAYNEGHSQLEALSKAIS